MRNIANIDWSKQSIQALEELWHKGENGQRLNESEYARMGRYGEIMNMAARDGIWPLTVSPGRNRFCSALREVLCRLPQAVFDKVDDTMRFLLDDPSLNMLAINAPAPRFADLSGRSSIDTIVFFRCCIELSPQALIGLIAQEIAHSFVCGNDYVEDEIVANKQAREWGFGKELDFLESEKQRLYPKESGSRPAGGKVKLKTRSLQGRQVKIGPQPSCGQEDSTLYQTAPPREGFRPAPSARIPMHD